MSYFPENQGLSVGLAAGRDQGFDDGYVEGRDAGYAAGFRAGDAAGWDRAVAQANENMRAQLEYTRQHVADKAALTKQLEEQSRLIDELTRRLDAMEKENAKLKETNQQLRDVVTALKEANERLRTQVVQIDQKYQERTKEYTRQLWDYNRSMVFLNSVRGVLEELTHGNEPQADLIRHMFAQRYGEEVSRAMTKGAIRVPPELDEDFAKTLPSTRRFIVEMLESVKREARPPEEMEHAATADPGPGF